MVPIFGTTVKDKHFLDILVGSTEGKEWIVRSSQGQRVGVLVSIDARNSKCPHFTDHAGLDRVGNSCKKDCRYLSLCTMMDNGSDGQGSLVETG